MISALPAKSYQKVELVVNNQGDFEMLDYEIEILAV
jgi:hypothetical protein